MPGEGLTHGPPAEKKQAAVTTGSADIRHSLRGGLHAYFAISPVLRLFGHRRQQGSSPAGLASASGCQDHATSRPPNAVRPRAIRARCDILRPPHPALHVRDDREAPLLWARDGVFIRLICLFCKAEYFSFQGLTRFRKTELVCASG